MSTMLLTGCGSGIGRHLARALSDLGHRVLATDVDEGGLAALAGVTTRRLDVRSEADWEAAMDAAEAAFGPVDVVMNIAGALRPGYVHEITAGDIDLHLDVNTKGLILGTRAAARRMIPRRSGHIVNFGSLASLAAVPGLSLYTASKFAVRGFSLAVATELAEHGVAVTLVMPDAVQTPMLDLQASFEEAALTFSGARPLSTADIERLVVDHVLPDRPLEAAIPAGRAMLARLASSAPAVARVLAPMLRKKGLANQGKHRTDTASTRGRKA